MSYENDVESLEIIRISSENFGHKFPAKSFNGTANWKENRKTQDNIHFKLENVWQPLNSFNLYNY